MKTVEHHQLKSRIFPSGVGGVQKNFITLVYARWPETLLQMNVALWLLDVLVNRQLFADVFTVITLLRRCRFKTQLCVTEMSLYCFNVNVFDRKFPSRSHGVNIEGDQICIVFDEKWCQAFILWGPWMNCNLMYLYKVCHCWPMFQADWMASHASSVFQTMTWTNRLCELTFCSILIQDR